MLPSFRLIAVTFLCGFVVVFAGLRLAASLNDIHEGLPVMAAHAAPVAIADITDQRRGSAAAPMYDLRFAVRSALQAPTPVNVTALVIDRAAPLDISPALSVAPLEALANEAAAPAEPATPADTVASIAPEQPVAADAAATPPSIDTPKPDAPVVATVGPPAAAPPDAVAAAVEPAAAPAVVQTTVESLPVAPAEPAPDAPAVASDPNPSAAKSAPRATVRKKRVRVAHRAAPANTPGPFNSNPATNPFSAEPR